VLVGRSWRARVLVALWLSAAVACADRGRETPAAGGGAAGTGGASPASADASRAGAPALVSPQAGSAGSVMTHGVRAQDAGTDAARPDSAAGTASPPDDPAGCAPGEFCESFENADALDPARWELATPNCSGSGEVAIDTAIAHGGAHALRITGGSGYCNHVFARPRADVLTLPEPLYARFYLRLDAALGSGHVTFLAMHDGAEDKDLRMGGQSEILMWNRESDDATLPELSPTGIAASVRPQARRWLCVELMVSHLGGLQTWVDGAAVAGLQVVGAPTADLDAQWQRKSDWQPQLQDVKLGWESYGDGANTIWFDDLAIAGERIGCE